ncbi:MAG: DUF1320 family protein [Sediminibacterium sp.]|nr:DUF1320 family protein [Sediminibacterium sp.]MDP3128810.1 DUF1320 family protein [Sediminibacterium sp.]
MPFITKDDFPASVHDDILNALTKGNNAVITENIDRTIDEMDAYMNARYDTTNIFNKAGNDRNKFILRIGVILSLYYIYKAHNPRKLTQSIVDDFEKAIEDLQKIQSGKLTPKGLALPSDDPTVNSGNGFPVQWGGAEQQGDSW